jgi:hypothetical protein
LQHSEAFGNGPDDIGHTHVTTHRIDTDGPPFRVSPYKVPYHQMTEIRNDISSMLQRGIIEKSNSPYCSPILLVPKSDGGRRFCVDFRRLNSKL